MCALCVSLAFIPPIWTSTRLMFNVLVLDFSVWLCPVLYVQRGFYQIVYHCFAMFCLLHCICSVICCRALCIWDAHFNWHVNCRALWPKRHGNHKAVLTDNWSQHNLQGPTKVPIAPKKGNILSQCVSSLDHSPRLVNVSLFWSHPYLHLNSKQKPANLMIEMYTYVQISKLIHICICAVFTLSAKYTFC